MKPPHDGGTKDGPEPMTKTFSLQIHMDNAAFDDEPATEAKRIINQVANRVGQGETEGKVWDINGNTVGSFAIKE